LSKVKAFDFCEEAFALSKRNFKVGSHFSWKKMDDLEGYEELAASIDATVTIPMTPNQDNSSDSGSQPVKKARSLSTFSGSFDFSELDSFLEGDERLLKIEENYDDFDGFLSEEKPKTASPRLTAATLKLENNTHSMLPPPTRAVAEVKAYQNIRIQQSYKVPVDHTRPATIRPMPCSKEEKRNKVLRYAEKRRRRVWKKEIKYNCRKQFAESRPRVAGRFIPKDGSDGVKSNKLSVIIRMLPQSMSPMSVSSSDTSDDEEVKDKKAPLIDWNHESFIHRKRSLAPTNERPMAKS